MNTPDKNICAHCGNEYVIRDPLQIPQDKYCSLSCAYEAHLQYRERLRKLRGSPLPLDNNPTK